MIGEGRGRMSGVLVSVIIPACEAHGTIGRALRSLLAQSWTDFEIIVVSDDGSDYAAVARAEGLDDPRLRFGSSGGVRTGCHKARNVGLAVARGDLVLHCDADDVSDPERLAVLVPLAMEHGAAVDNPAVVSEETGQLLYRAFPPEAAPRQLGASAFLDTTVPLFPLLRRDVAEPRLAGIEHIEDVVANLRVIDALGSLSVVPRSLSEYRVVPGSMCHGADAAVLFDGVYGAVLARLRGGDGLGLSPALRGEAEAGLERKRAFNHAFGEAARQEPGLTFQDYAARVSAAGRPGSGRASRDRAAW
jgi:succinoglycan biosynthesis protein ExoO